MSNPRRSQQALFYASDFAIQSDFATALANAAIDRALARDDSGNIEVEIVLADFTVMDCTGEYIAEKLYTARSSRISAPFYADADTLFGFLGWAGGVVADDVVTLLPPFSYQPPPTSLIYCNRSSGIDPLKFKGMCVDRIEASGRSGNRISGTIQWRGHGAPTVEAGYTPPDCENSTPVFLKDGAFTLDGSSRVQDLRAFSFVIDNKLVFQEDPFPFNDVDIFRMERAEQRDWPLNITLAGAVNDPTWQKAVSVAEHGNEVDYSMRIGPSDDGITIASVGDAIMEMTGVPGYDGQVARQTLPLRLTALRPSGEPSPITITRNLPPGP